MSKNYQKEQTSEITNRYLSGRTVTELSSELGNSRSKLYKWIDESSDCKKQKRNI